MGKTPHYVFMAILLIVGLWSAWGIQQASDDIARGNAQIDQAAAMAATAEDESLAKLEEAVQQAQHQALMHHEAQRARGINVAGSSAQIDVIHRDMQTLD